jgi:hypothetical protein
MQRPSKKAFAQTRSQPLKYTESLKELRQCVDELALNEEVVELLLPSGQPHDIETALWDYKEKLPTLPESGSVDDKKKA